MSATASLRAALGQGYRHSWRLVLLNCAVGVVVAGAAAGAAYVLPAALLVLAAGPLLAALAHCAVVVARTDELSWSDAGDGLRLHWRLGIRYGALGAGGIALGILAIRFYSLHAVWPLSALAAYLLACFCVWQLVAWPLAVAGAERPLATAARELARRPRSALLLGTVLLAVNVLGTLAIIPVLTLTLAYSFLAAAHFVLEAN
ncbi:MAG TPA: hypothetical protein VMU58_10110 [Gaiellaceae bacterium]|nr:hypothetical protein [Gaiellaceae bacterium]